LIETVSIAVDQCSSPAPGNKRLTAEPVGVISGKAALDGAPSVVWTSRFARFGQIPALAKLIGTSVSHRDSEHAWQRPTPWWT
jgi:hypothetical protein